MNLFGIEGEFGKGKTTKKVLLKKIIFHDYFNPLRIKHLDLLDVYDLEKLFKNLEDDKNLDRGGKIIFYTTFLILGVYIINLLLN